MRNEWRDNLWLVLELTIVTGVIWFLAIITYGNFYGALEPRGFQYEDVYTLQSKYIRESSPYHVATPDSVDDFNEDFIQLVHRLRANPHVEAVGFHQNGISYNYNYHGNFLNRLDVKDSIMYMGNVRMVSPDVVGILGYTSRTGKTTAQLEDMLRRGELLVANSISYESNGRDPLDLVGKQVIMNGDSSMVYRVGDVIQNVRRTDYEKSWGGTIVIPKREDGTESGDIVLKVRTGHDIGFKEDFRNNSELRRQRNTYLSDLQKLSDIRKECQRETENTMRQMATLIVFLLATVFLGMLGTFWFRIQQRVGEIAMRKVCGATSTDVFRRILGEGMILLAVAVVLVSALVWSFFSYFSDLFYFCEWKEFLVFELIAVALVGIGITASLWYPASRAMRIEPALALKSE